MGGLTEHGSLQRGLFAALGALLSGPRAGQRIESDADQGALLRCRARHARSRGAFVESMNGHLQQARQAARRHLTAKDFIAIAYSSRDRCTGKNTKRLATS